MVRNVLGSLLALAGAAAAVLSPFRAWYDGRHGSDVRVNDLFTGVGVTDHDAALLGSLFLPMGFAALLTLLGVLARSWPVVALAGFLVLGVTVLWTVRQARAAGSLTAGGSGLDTGVGLAVLGGLLLFGGAYLLSGLSRRRYGEPDTSALDGSSGQMPAAPPPNGPGTLDSAAPTAPASPGVPTEPPRAPYDQPLAPDSEPPRP